VVLLDDVLLLMLMLVVLLLVVWVRVLLVVWRRERLGQRRLKRLRRHAARAEGRGQVRCARLVAVAVVGHRRAVWAVGRRIDGRNREALARRRLLLLVVVVVRRRGVSRGAHRAATA
jgi:hypothetical protein